MSEVVQGEYEDTKVASSKHGGSEFKGSMKILRSQVFVMVVSSERVG